MSRRGPQISIGTSAHAMYSQIPMMQSDLMGGGPDDQVGLGGPLGTGGGGGNDFGSGGDPHHHQHHHQQQQQQQQQQLQQQQQHSHLLNRAAVNRFMLAAPSTTHGHHHHHHPSKMYQLSPTTSPPRQRGRKPQNVHPSMVIDQHSYVAMKPEPGVPFDMFSQNNMSHLVMQSSADMVVGQNMEVGGSDPSNQTTPHGEIILVPNNMLKPGMLEGGEVVVGGGGSIGNEIVIDNRPGRLPMGSAHGLSGVGGVGVGGSGGAVGHGGGGSSSVANSSSSEDNDYDDSALVIDTTAMQRGNAPGVGGVSGGNASSGHPVGYDCAECGAVMKSRGSLKKHIAKYHAPAPEQEVDLENRVYACPACPYQTQRRDKLDKHVGKHLAEGLTLTGKRRGGGSGGSGGGGSSGSKGNSNFPQRMRHAAEEYRCPFCPYKCTVEKALRKHNKLHQTGTKQFVVKVSCMICGKDRSTEADLRKHMKKHREGKDFHCDICGFASIQLKKIIQHRRMHTGEKPHLCPHCTYRSSRRDNLRSHVRRMHKKENMYIDTFNPRTDIPMDKRISLEI